MTLVVLALDSRFGAEEALAPLELQTLDWRFRLRGPEAPSGEVVLVLADDPTLAELGTWPPSRGVIASAVDRLSRAGARVILLNLLLERDIIPVVPPLGCDGVGRSYRLNSDAVAVEVAKTLGAVKLVYLTTEGGVRGSKGMIRQMTVEEAADQVLAAGRVAPPIIGEDQERRAHTRLLCLAGTQARDPWARVRDSASKSWSISQG